MRVLDLFSGIGGFSLGLERAGMTTVAFCEIDPFARAVLAKHWPNVRCYHDVKALTLDSLTADGIVADLICGGFPCQDISVAGRGAGLSGERSGLWVEFARIIEEVQPTWIIIENVSVLRSRGLDAILGRLNAIGYDAEWHCIPASAVGAPHRRDRIWIVAYPNSSRCPRPGQAQSEEWICDPVALGACATVAYPHSTGLEIGEGERGYPRQKLTSLVRSDWWAVEPDVGRVAYGIPNRIHRLRCLGNAIVPQIAEIIGRTIMASQ